MVRTDYNRYQGNTGRYTRVSQSPEESRLPAPRPAPGVGPIQRPVEPGPRPVQGAAPPARPAPVRRPLFPLGNLGGSGGLLGGLGGSGGLLGGLGGKGGLLGGLGGKGGLLGGLGGLGGKGGLLGGLGDSLGGLLGKFNLSELETEDLLLLLILYLMYRESGDSELLLIMGAMFLV